MKNYLLNFASANSTLTTGLAPTMVLFARMDTGATLAAPGISEIVSGFGLYSFQWGATTPIVFMCDGATSGLGSFRYIKGSLDPADRSDEYGNTLVAIGNTLIFNTPANMGATLVAIGNSAIALGTSNVALGTTNVALGTTILAAELAQGFTLQAIGSTLSALGTSNIALGTTMVAIGTSLQATSGTIVVTVTGLGSTASIIGDSTHDPVDLFGYIKRVHELLSGQQTYLKVAGTWTMFDRTGATLLTTRTLTNSISTVIKT